MYELIVGLVLMFIRNQENGSLHLIANFYKCSLKKEVGFISSTISAIVTLTYKNKEPYTDLIQLQQLSFLEKEVVNVNVFLLFSFEGGYFSNFVKSF